MAKIMRRQRKIITYCFLIIFLLSGGAVNANNEKGLSRVLAQDRESFITEEKVALIIGLSNYPSHGGLSQLDYADDDAQAMGKQLEDLGYRVRVLTNYEATGSALINVLDDLGSYLTPGQGTFLFYFSGHGFAKNKINYLATYETNPSTIQHTGLSLNTVIEHMQRSGAKRQVLLVDACRNDPEGGEKSAGGIDRSFNDFNMAEGTQILFSTRFGGSSYEYSRLNHGVYTHFLLKGLKGKARQRDGAISFADLASYVSKEVKNYGFKTKRTQIPFVSGESYGDILLHAKKGQVLASLTTPKMQATPFDFKTSQALQKSYKIKLEKYKQTQRMFDRAQVAGQNSLTELRYLTKEKNQASDKLQTIQRIERENPDIELAEKAQKARRENQQAFKAHRKEEKQLKERQEKSDALEKQLKKEILELNGIAKKVKRKYEQQAEKELEKRMDGLQKSFVVDGEAKVGCEDDRPKKCRQRTLQNAERDASENGVFEIVSRITRLDNVTLSEIKIKKAVKTRLSNVKVLEKGWFSDTAYQYRIRAKITPIIGSAVTEHIRQSIFRGATTEVPGLIVFGEKIPEFNPVSRKTAAEKSFDELERESGVTLEEYDFIEIPARNDKPIEFSQTSSAFQPESWYVLLGAGIATSEAGEGPSLDLGVYWPRANSALYGISASLNFTNLSDNFDYTEQSHIALSTLNFLGKPIGSGFFLRGDVGYGIASSSTASINGFGETERNSDSGSGFGFILGLGYSKPITKGFRVMFSVDFSVVPAVTAANSLNFRISTLW